MSRLDVNKLQQNKSTKATRPTVLNHAFEYALKFDIHTFALKNMHMYIYIRIHAHSYFHLICISYT